ncbi:hypothetical protein ASPSYDRAFT_80205 [Aspergillus sydowii CBS 593.65]|uniref:Acetoacetate decarboxylase n=1 Tax=Aspergillus sydowii CBS 593.65 TaxID=1036612 RepID=A0A1L9TCZ5_9EURO|nr:uncharacterized protein ASPSYDRAFT_80205 [Aspergillus sydowii CBS 593.65]OJJ57265.1 hypothetical protein ASPSYDRAFT_80205 [Aspergillus sydowii CBS 593.65]
MSYVASHEEIVIWEEFSSKPEFSQEGIGIPFHTTFEYVKSVLPPGFEPAAEPKGSILVGTMESKLCGEFDCTLVTLDAKFKGITGKYCLLMLISGDTPVTWGREVWGETKKTGVTRLWRSGNYRYGYAERNGVRLIEVEMECGDELAAETVKGSQFEIKAYPHSQGKGLQWEPKVNVLEVVEHKTRRATGRGRVTVRGTRADPLHSIPILSVGEFEYVSGLAEYTVVAEHDLGCGNAYMPYLIGRHYDDLRIFRVGAQWNKLQNTEVDVDETFPVQRLSSR